MRDIEYRVWNKCHKIIANVEILRWSSECKIKIDDYNEEEVELMAYTGKKDKNGKKIFEGDIVRNNRINWIFEIIWCSDAGKFQMQNIDDCEMIDLNSDLISEVHEVIGNIYENPELLEAYR